MCFAPLPQQLLVRFSPLSTFQLRTYACSVFCEERRNFDAKGVHFAVNTAANLLLTLE